LIFLCVSIQEITRRKNTAEIAAKINGDRAPLFRKLKNRDGSAFLILDWMKNAAAKLIATSKAVVAKSLIE